MSEAPFIASMDCSTGEATLRPATAEEIAQFAIDAATPEPEISTPVTDLVGAALHALDPATATVSELLAALAPIFPAPAA